MSHHAHFILLQDALVDSSVIPTAKNAQELKPFREAFQQKDEQIRRGKSSRLDFFKLIVTLAWDTNLITSKQNEKLSTQSEQDTTNEQIDVLFSKVYNKLKANDQASQERKQKKKQVKQAAIISDSVKNETLEACVKFLTQVKSVDEITTDHVRLHCLLLQLGLLSGEKTLTIVKSDFVKGWLLKILTSPISSSLSEPEKLRAKTLLALATEWMHILCLHYKKAYENAYRLFRYNKAKKAHEKEAEKKKEAAKEARNLLKKKKEKELEEKKKEILEAAAEEDLFEVQDKELELEAQEAELKKKAEESDDEDEDENNFKEENDVKVMDLRTAYVRREIVEKFIKGILNNQEALGTTSSNQLDNSLSRIIMFHSITATTDLLFTPSEGSTRFEEIAVMLVKAGFCEMLNFCLDPTRMNPDTKEPLGLALFATTVISGCIPVVKELYTRKTLAAVVNVLLASCSRQKGNEASTTKASSSSQASSLTFDPHLISHCCYIIGNTCAKYEELSELLNADFNKDNALIREVLSVVKYRGKKSFPEELVAQMNFTGFAALSALLQSLPVTSILDLDNEFGITDLIIQDLGSGQSDFYHKLSTPFQWELKYSAMIIAKVICTRIAEEPDQKVKSTGVSVFRKLIDPKVLGTSVDALVSKKQDKKPKLKNQQQEEQNKKPTREDYIFSRYIIPASISCMSAVVHNVTKMKDPVGVEKLDKLIQEDQRKYITMLGVVRQIESSKVETGVNPKKVLLWIGLLVVILISLPLIYKYTKGESIFPDAQPNVRGRR